MEDRREVHVEGTDDEAKRLPLTSGEQGTEQGFNKSKEAGLSATSSQTKPATTRVKAAADSGDSEERSDERSETFDLSPPPVIEKDKVIFGKYRLIEKIGEGGMGSVWLVHNVELDRKSAIKLIKAEIAQNDKGWRRFRREAQLMAKLEHPNAVAVYDFKRTQGMGYIEMEFVRGRSLDKILQERQGEPLPLDVVTDIVDQLCSVLQEAHTYADETTGKSKAIIHRDLKPSNLMILDRKPPGQNLKVLDFGIAKMVDEDVQGATELTGAGDILGTPAYMSPEQIRGTDENGEPQEIDGRSDLYSTGVMLYQLLTGVLPFRGNRMSILASHLTKAPPPLREANPKLTVPPEVERVVLQCLEKDPSKRPGSPRELAVRFRSAAGSPTSGSAVPARKTRGLPIALGAAGAVILGLGGFWSLRSRPSSTPATHGPTNTSAVTAGDLQAEGLLAPKTTVETGQGEEEGVWSLPSTYQADASELRRTDGPSVITRTTDNVRFKRFTSGIYLPDGYIASDPDDLVNGFPRVITRKADGVQFVRIAGGVYQQGDYRLGTPMLDNRGNPCTPHSVNVADFYLQETEVTNAEIQDFNEPDAQRGRWRKALELVVGQVKNDKEALKYPAVCLNWATALKYAQSVGGRLPTESEWEYAARSQGQERRWGVNRRLPNNVQPKANLLDNAAGSPVPVKSFPGEDETDQHIFDMTGNVREWCADPYRPYAELMVQDGPAKKPEVFKADPAQGYVVRGGSFQVDSQAAKTFNRDVVQADEELADLGFRVVIDCPYLATPR